MSSKVLELLVRLPPPPETISLSNLLCEQRVVTSKVNELRKFIFIFISSSSHLHEKYMNFLVKFSELKTLYFMIFIAPIGSCASQLLIAAIQTKKYRLEVPQARGRTD